MSVSWANSGVDLHLDLDLRHPRIGLERALREAIRDGRLGPGTTLPASRTLARDLGIARNTVAEAYGQLVAEGWLTARQGSGTRVAERGPGPAGQTSRLPGTAPGTASGTAPDARFDLRAGVPDLAGLPRASWSAAARRALTDAPNDVLGYGDPRGLAALRTGLAGYLGRVRGVHVDPDHVVVTSGFTQGLRLLAEVLAGRGATAIGVEAYGHEAHRRVIRAAGLTTVPLAVDAAGAEVDGLSTAGVQAAVLTPAHQFPLGSVLSSARRQAVVRWAEAAGGWLLEDDYDGEFRYDRQPVGAVQALAPQRVVYAGSVSKTLAPGIRVGWLVLPDALLGPVTEAKARNDAGTSTTDQLTLAELIGSGEYDRIVRRARLRYRRRRDRLLEALRREVPAASVEGVAAGLHALVRLPPGRSEDEVVAAAARRGLRLDGLGTFAADGRPHPPALVVGYARPPDHALTGALARLVATLR